MPKKQKSSKKSVATDGEAPPAIAKAEAPSPVKATKKASKPSVRKTATTARKTKTAKASTGTHTAEPSADQIQLRAYFISEQRHRIGVPGDRHSDWLEARRQLLLEARQR